MQNVLRPYATAGVALVGASIIAVTPLAVPPPQIQTRPVKLVDAWSQLVADTTENLQLIAGNADSSDISQVFSALLTNPLGVISALTNLDPTVATDTSGLPITVGVELTPALELGLAQLGAEGATLDAINSVVGQLASDPSNALNILYEGTASILNAGLNGADNVSLLGGIISIPVFNGLLAPETSLTADLNLTELINALGLGNLGLGSLDLSGLLSQLHLGDLTIGSLFSDLDLSTKTLGDLLDNPTLSSVLGELGLGNFDLSGLNLTDILTGLGVNTDLNDLSLSAVLNAFQLNLPIIADLSNFLSGLGFGSLPDGNGFLDTGLGTDLADLGLLPGLVTGLNGVLGTLLGPIIGNPIVAGLLPGINLSALLTPDSLETALNDTNITIGDLLGNQNVDVTASSLLGLLGISVPTDGLTIGGILTALGVTDTTDDLTLGGLLTALGVGTDPVASLLDLQLGTVLTDLGIAGDPLNLADLGSLTNLDLGSLLGDLGLGDLAHITVDPFGGLLTELVDIVPAQILAAL
jgi:hypothetical protein